MHIAHSIPATLQPAERFQQVWHALDRPADPTRRMGPHAVQDPRTEPGSRLVIVVHPASVRSSRREEHPASVAVSADGLKSGQARKRGFRKANRGSPWPGAPAELARLLRIGMSYCRSCRGYQEKCADGCEFTSVERSRNRLNRLFWRFIYGRPELQEHQTSQDRGSRRWDDLSSSHNRRGPLQSGFRWRTGHISSDGRATVRL